MKTKNALTLVAAVTAALLAQGSYAQTGMSPASSPKGYVPAGPAPLPASDKAASTGTSTESMADVKAKTKADAKNHKLTPAGEAITGSGDATSTSGTKASREKVKADTKAAEKNGTLTPAGEGSGATMKK